MNLVTILNWSSCYLKYISRIENLSQLLITSFWLSLRLFSILVFIELAHDTLATLDVYGSTIFHIRNVWSRELKPSSLKDWVSFFLQYLNMESSVADSIFHHRPWLPWGTLNCVDRTIEFTTLHAPQRPGLSCWGSYYMCRTCLHGIWGS